MRYRPRASEERVIASYAAAVAVAVLVFYGGLILDARLHPVVPPPEGPPAGVLEAVFTFGTAFLLVLVAAAVPVLVGLATFRWARVTHPAWFAAYGTAMGVLLANLFRDLNTGLALPGFAGAVGGLTFRAVMGRPAETAQVTTVPTEGQTNDRQVVRSHLIDHEAHAAYLSDALLSDDPALVVLALKEIGTACRIAVALDENPPLGEVLRTVRELGFDLEAVPIRPPMIGPRPASRPDHP